MLGGREDRHDLLRSLAVRFRPERACLHAREYSSHSGGKGRPTIVRVTSTLTRPTCTGGVQLRRWVDDHTASLFTLSDQDRQALSPQKERAATSPAAAAVKPDTRTPIEYFKENPWNKKGGEAQLAAEETAKKV